MNDNSNRNLSQINSINTQFYSKEILQQKKKIIEQHTIPETQCLLKLVQFLQLHQQIQPHHID